MFIVSALGQQEAQLGASDAFNPPRGELKGLQPLEAQVAAGWVAKQVYTSMDV